MNGSSTVLGFLLGVVKTILLLAIVIVVGWIILVSGRAVGAPASQFGSCPQGMSCLACANYWSNFFWNAVYKAMATPGATLTGEDSFAAESSRSPELPPKRTSPVAIPARKVGSRPPVQHVGRGAHDQEPCITPNGRPVCDATHGNGCWGTIERFCRPGDRLTRVSSWGLASIKHGQTLTTREIGDILFINAPCELPLAQAESMRRAWISPGRIGCWYPTLDDGYTFVSDDGMFQHATNPYEVLPFAWMHTDGTLTVDDPKYNYAEALRDYYARLTAKVHKPWNEQP